MYNMNGPPQGYNTTSNQSAYDLVFKDIVVKSTSRNTNMYPNPNNYIVELNVNLQKIYKAELIEVYIPAATDPAVNITPEGNILYLIHNGTTYTIPIQAGTYFNPASVADELTRLIAIVNLPVTVTFDLNLNRYNINCTQGVVEIDITSNYNIAQALMITAFNSEVRYPLPLVSGPRIIDQDIDGNLYVADASSYGSVPLTSDPIFSNCILSNVVLTECRLFLSLGQLDGNTVSLVSNNNPTDNTSVPQIFCQIPNNSYTSSANVKTLLNQPNVYSSIQFYNPVLNDVNRFHVRWYSENGKLLNILEHCFTIRIYYFQKRNSGTDFSIQVVTNTPSGYINSAFSG